MKATLIDGLIKVHVKSGLMHGTSFLAFNSIGRVLAKQTKKKKEVSNVWFGCHAFGMQTEELVIRGSWIRRSGDS